MSYTHKTLKITLALTLVHSLLCKMASTKRLREAMEIILAICVTGLGIFGGMLIIWNGQNRSSSKAPDDSRTGYSNACNNTDLYVHDSCLVIRRHPFGDYHQRRVGAQPARPTRMVDSVIG